MQDDFSLSESAPDDVVLEQEDIATGPAQRRKRPRKGLALCLSGGGFRASIFHLGALTRLNELGVLPKVNTFSCVSGGSIIGGYLARLIKEGRLQVRDGVYHDWQEVVSGFLPFVRKDIRTRAFLAQLAFWRFRTAGRAARRLAKYYAELTGGLKLTELPDSPRFVFCATDLVYANSWVSERGRVGDYRTGYVKPPPGDWDVARAVAASSCFPPIFAPLPTDLPGSAYAKPEYVSDLEFKRDERLRDQVRLTDGGVYDNLGLEPVWKSHETVLVSDGGKPLQYQYVAPGRRLMRYTDVIQNQVNSLRKRWLIDTFERAKQEGTGSDTFNGTYWGINNSTSDYPLQPPYGYGKELAEEVIANVRTDLDPFSPNEIGVLLKHGYELADVALNTYMKQLIVRDGVSAPVWPSALSDGRMVREALGRSLRRRPIRVWPRHRADHLLEGRSAESLLRTSPQGASGPYVTSP